MNEIRLKASLPNKISSTIRVDEQDKIKDWVKILLRENNINSETMELLTYKNNVHEVSLQSSFAEAGFANGDELTISFRSRYDEPELDDIPPVDEGMSFHQLGILVLDGSESMGEPGNNGISLAEWVNRAVREFLGFFKNSSQVNNFSIAVITFDHEAKIHTPVTPLKDMNDFAEYNPLHDHGGGTFIGNALEKAEEVALGFLKTQEKVDIPNDVKIIIMSDGLCQHPEKTTASANRIKLNNKINICSTLFTLTERINDDYTSAAKALLSNIASTPNFYKTTYKESDLREFFISSLSAKKQFGNGRK